MEVLRFRHYLFVSTSNTKVALLCQTLATIAHQITMCILYMLSISKE